MTDKIIKEEGVTLESLDDSTEYDEANAAALSDDVLDDEVLDKEELHEEVSEEAKELSLLKDRFTLMEKEVGSLREKAQIYDALMEDEDFNKFLTGEWKVPPAAPVKEPEPDFENMTNRELIQYVVKEELKSAVGGLRDELKPSLEKIDKTSSAVEANRYVGEVQAFMNERDSEGNLVHPHGMAVRETMADLFSKGSVTTLDAAYKLACVEKNLPLGPASKAKSTEKENANLLPFNSTKKTVPQTKVYKTPREAAEGALAELEKRGLSL